MNREEDKRTDSKLVDATVVGMEDALLETGTLGSRSDAPFGEPIGKNRGANNVSVRA